MSHIELQPDSVMRVEAILYSGYIPPLKAIGPLKKCSVKVSDIINLLNNDIRVVLRDDQVENLYFFVKEYNLYIKKVNSSLPRAEHAEELLYNRLTNNLNKTIKEEEKTNPFINNEENDDLDIAAETIAVQSNGSASKMKDPLKKYRKQTIKRGHVYDIFSNAEKSDNIITNIDNLNMIRDYGNIDFELD